MSKYNHPDKSGKWRESRNAFIPNNHEDANAIAHYLHKVSFIMSVVTVKFNRSQATKVTDNIIRNLCSIK